MPDPDRLAALKRRLSVAFELSLPDEQALADSITRQRAQAWRATMTEEARAVGSRQRGQGPSGADAAYLHELSVEDAQSIRETYNRELMNQIEQVYAAKPDGTRDEYVRELTQWADARARWKDRQIANMNRQTARSYAQERFATRNRVGRSLYLFTGPPPKEEHCADHFAAGLVTREYKEANETPIHINCPHQWTKQRGSVGVPMADLWVGA
jgi:hypothetical protein